MRPALIFRPPPEGWQSDGTLADGRALFTDGLKIIDAAWWGDAWRCVHTTRCVPADAEGYADYPDIIVEKEAICAD